MPIKRNTGLMLAVVLAFGATASAQMVVHAITGKIKAINTASKTLDVVAVDDSTDEFTLPAKQVQLDFNNDLRSESVDPDKFQHVGDFAVVYYYGYEPNRTAVAVKDLGAAAFQKVNGTVVSFDKKERLMKVRDATGKVYSFKLSDHLIVDNGMGVDNGRKYEPHKGVQVRVTYASSGDQNSAVFVSETSLSY